MLNAEKSRFITGKKLLLISFLFFVISQAYSQDITNTLGTNGEFIIKDASNTFFTLDQTNGQIKLPYSLGSTTGSIFKGTDRFLHTYAPSSSHGCNTFLGINAGNFTMGGGFDFASYNTGIGYSSLNSNTSGHDNTAIGYNSLCKNANGFFNTAVGTWSLNLNTSGDYNTAVGHNSLLNTSTGCYNTAIGFNSGTTITYGYRNTCIGYDSQVPVGSSNNQVRIGNTSVGYAGIQVAWNITSDKKWKQDIMPLNLGLGFISKLNPVSCTRKNDENRKPEYGFIAQEIEEVLEEYNVDNSGMITVDDDGRYELRYNDLLAPMVKAIQELNDKNESLEKEIQQLKKENESLKTVNNKLAELEKLIMEMKSNENKIKEIKSSSN